MNKIKKSYKGINRSRTQAILNPCENYITRKPSFIQASYDMNKGDGRLDRKIHAKSITLTKLRYELDYQNPSEYRRRYLSHRIAKMSNQLKNLCKRKHSHSIATQ